MRSNLPPEARLILACARADAAAVPQEEVRELLEQRLDWAYLHRLAFHHGQLPFLHVHLSRLAPERVPGDTSRVLEAFSAGIREQNRVLLKTMFDLMARWKQRGIRVMPYVETMSSFAFYRRTDLRACTWLDFVIRTGDLGPAKETLSGLQGWTELSDPLGDVRSAARQSIAIWSGGPRNCGLSLHTATAPWERAVRLKLQEAWAGAATVRLGERELASLRPQDALLHLCAYNSEYLWPSLQGITDIAELVRGPINLDWSGLLAQARESGVRRTVLVGLALAHILLDVALPETVIAGLQEDRAAQSLAERIVVELFAAAPRPRRTPEMLRMHLRLRDNAGDQGRYLWRYLISPTEADLAWVRLPTGLRYLYPWLRPVRLAGAAFRRVAGRPMRAASRRPESVSGYSPSAPPVVQRMLELAEIGPSDVVYDLGCGDGRIVIEAARRFGVAGVGFDLDPQRIRECEENARAAGVQDLVSFRHQDVMQADLKAATVVMMYLPAAPTLRLVARLIEELQPGARILSHNSDPGGWDHVEVCAGERVPALLYLRRVPQKIGTAGAKGASTSG